MSRPRVSWLTLYAEPAIIVLACVSFALAFSVVLRSPDTGRADFYTFWDSARWYREGLDPYLGRRLRPDAGYNLNPPALIFLFLPFSFLPLRIAFVVWTLFGLLACAVAAHFIARALGLRSAFLVLCGLLISQSTFAAFQIGQLTPVLLPLFTLAWLSDRSDRPWTAGMLLGLLVAAKPFLGVFALYAAVFRRSRQMTVGMAIGVLGLSTVGLFAGGMPAYRSWLSVLRAVTWPAHLANASLLAVVVRELTRPPNLIRVTPIAVRPDWVLPIWGITVALACIIAFRTLSRKPDCDRTWFLLGSSALLLSPLGWGYYAPLVAGPLIARWQAGRIETRVWIAAGYACFCVPYALLQQPLGPVPTFFFGSIYTWGLVAWFIAAIR